MTDDIFNSAVLNDSYRDNGIGKELFEKVIEQLNSLTDQTPSSDKEVILQDAYKFSMLLKQSTNPKIQDINDNFEKINNFVSNKMKIDDNSSYSKPLKTTLDQESTSAFQNKMSMRTFLETNLYIILKVLFILLLIYFSLKLLKNTSVASASATGSAGVGVLWSNVTNYFKNIKTKTNSLSQKAKEKMQQIDEKRREKSSVNKFMNKLDINTNKNKEKTSEINNPFKNKSETNTKVMNNLALNKPGNINLNKITNSLQKQQYT